MPKIEIVVCAFCPRDKEVRGVAIPVEVNKKQFTIDVCGTHQSEVQETIRKFQELMEWAEPVRSGTAGQSRRPRPTRTIEQRQEVAAIRQWAKENGLDVGDRGRIAPEVREAFHQARAAARPRPTVVPAVH